MRAIFRPTHWLTACALCALALLASPPAQATQKWPQAVLVTLPPYCADSELSHSYNRFGPRWQYWVSRMGDLFNSIHHYCEGMLRVREARRMPAGSQGQVIALRRALSEYNYILDGADVRRLRAFPLWPEMLLRRGEVAVLMEDWALAGASYEQARLVKPDYWPAYLDWAEKLASLKLTQQARDLVRQGLQVDPSVETLRQAFLKYGGALKDIPEKAAAVSEPAAAPASAPQAPASAASLPQTP
ncbi:hypothetical protein [Inhella sp.]|uniref:hypothetical protein n=1 Tax=Inhella sp. TaxID=1921806 RepID=UPI0035B080C4